MMTDTPLVRNQQLVNSPFDGMDFDISRLTAEQTFDLSNVMNKSRNGTSLTMKDLSVVMQARKAARKPTTVPAKSSFDDLTAAIQQLKAMFR